MNGLFVTGTGTGVGKTVLGALLLAELRRRGLDAAYFKPVQTGCADGAPDLDYALSMAALPLPADRRAAMCPLRFEPACSPHLAAEMAGTEIGIPEMVAAARTLVSEYEFVVAEGAGGVLVPLNRRETTLDLMQALKFPILIAARPGLGTINHTLLTLLALRSGGVEVAGVVFVASQPGAPGLVEEDNAATIGRLGRVPILGTIPFCAALAGPAPRYDDLPIPVVAETEKIVNRLGV